MNNITSRLKSLEDRIPEPMLIEVTDGNLTRRVTAPEYAANTFLDFVRVVKGCSMHDLKYLVEGNKRRAAETLGGSV